MYAEPLDRVPLWLLFVALIAMSWAALEGGYRLGKWRHARTAEEKDTPVGAMVGTILGLLAFMLAFTFGLAASRFDDRRQTVLQEANAIGTTYLRARMLPEPEPNESAKLWREYVDVRIRGVEDGTVDRAIARSEELHELLWSQAVTAADKRDSPITGLYV